ncbi:hypothetical protein K493DRAFT_334281 [Basidiobolus meristosporus CBS 931.73]|uniref:DDHD domain-containing protein n=1 Tax=Basidiobolus meristosporus CBS 931.73 TaxID=1314790 RepID=A0A1Y1YZI5_9FUNG|nr:hypothetical protein K493DRAFT_334281 [Basidiobolus meristosporus CBS 931.73]|eukprot:ORY03356.1 hypothetical protein K493DRAFT_334281 [Basidiobolus meristosporus CBS 931.73]
METPPENKVEHVFFMVHGMGPTIGNRGKYIMRVEQFRENIKEVVAAKFPEVQGSVEVIPLEWHNVLHDIVDMRMNSITLPTCPAVRRVNNDIIADVLYYFTNRHGQKIIDIVAKALNAEYEAFMEKHPYYTGEFSVIGYSLGGVCVYDILSHQEEGVNADGRDCLRFEVTKLLFKPRNLFTFGSPLGAVMVMRDQTFDTYRLPDYCELYNIFHQYDPIGYRLEPLIDTEYKTIPPVVLENFYDSRFPISMNSIIPSLPSLNQAKEVFSRQMATVFGYTQVEIEKRASSSLLEQEDSDIPKRRKMEVIDLTQDPNPAGESSESEQKQSSEMDDKEQSSTTRRFLGTVMYLAEKFSIISPTPLESSEGEGLSELEDTVETVLGEFYSDIDGPPTEPVAFNEEVPEASSVDRAVLFNQCPDLSHRIDFTLQESFVHYVANEYLVGSRAHFSYWNHRDVAYHLLKKCFGK